MQDLILGGLTGIAAGTLQQILHTHLYYEFMKLRLVPFNASRWEAFMNRVDRTLRPGLLRSVRTLLFAPGIPLALTMGFIFGPWAAAGVAVGYPLVPVITMLTLRWLGPDFIRKIHKLAIDRLMRHGRSEAEQESRTMQILERVAATASTETKVYAIRQIGRLGAPKARELLKKYKSNLDHRLHLAAESALASLDGMLSGSNLLSAKQLPVFIDEAEYWHRQYYSRRGPARRDSREKQLELMAIVNDIVDSQLMLRQAYPDLLCQKCRTRAEEHTHGRWTYVLCRHCGDVLDLETEVRIVVGCIGHVPDGKSEEGVLYLDLWDWRQKKAVFADLDRLEIRGGSDLNYDWAVSSLVAQLREHTPEGGWKIEVLLIDNPPLDANSKMLLREIGWEG